MILTEVAPAWIRICLILVLVSGGFLLSSRSLKNLVRTYQLQSFLLVLIALGLVVLDAGQMDERLSSHAADLFLDIGLRHYAFVALPLAHARARNAVKIRFRMTAGHSRFPVESLATPT